MSVRESQKIIALTGDSIGNQEVSNVKKYISIVLLVICILISGCSKTETAPNTSSEEGNILQETSDNPSSEETASENTNVEEEAPEETLSFTEFKNLQFIFSSGAGGWATYLNIHEDGSFAGEYFDGDMGVTGEDYPNGTMYQCNFSGQFTQPIKVNDYTYSMKIQKINYENEAGTEKIIDGTLYIYSEPYGLDGAEAILIYLPGAPLEELPEDFKNWTNYYIYSESDGTALPFLGLYNEAEQYGFSSYDLVESVSAFVSASEATSAMLKESLQNETLSQGEMNEKAQQMYEDWDYTLNYVWSALKKTLPEDEMNTLLAEQREWISSKEQALKEAGAEFEGGSLQPMVMNQKAAELTQNRVYELMEYFN